MVFAHDYWHRERYTAHGREVGSCALRPSAEEIIIASRTITNRFPLPPFRSYRRRSYSIEGFMRESDASSQFYAAVRYTCFWRGLPPRRASVSNASSWHSHFPVRASGKTAFFFLPWAISIKIGSYFVRDLVLVRIIFEKSRCRFFLAVFITFICPYTALQLHRSI